MWMYILSFYVACTSTLDIRMYMWMHACMHACMDGWMDGWIDG